MQYRVTPVNAKDRTCDPAEDARQRTKLIVFLHKENNEKGTLFLRLFPVFPEKRRFSRNFTKHKNPQYYPIFSQVPYKYITQIRHPSTRYFAQNNISILSILHKLVFSIRMAFFR